VSYLQVVAAQVVGPTLGFVFVVPGHQIWRPRAFRAVAARGVGGAPARAYTLTITNGTDIVAVVGAQDAGAEPGTCSVTWAPTPAAVSASGAVGVSVAPLGLLVLPAGYVVTGAIVGAAPADSWVSAVCWVDYDYAT
jgi:hypothetical protein